MILTIIGARPQFIKAAPMSAALREAGIKENILHTGQHYDYNMSQKFFEDLEIPAPCHHLEVESGHHGRQTAAMMVGIEEICLSQQPDAVLVFGDTNSTLAAALVASKLHIPLAHVEAGLRSFNRRMPEEINRVLTDHLSNLFFCSTENGAENLRKEGINNDGVHIVGDIMFDALKFTLARFPDTPNPASKILGDAPYIAATIHRAENTDNPDNLREIFQGFVNCELPVVCPLHPRTRSKLQHEGINTGEFPGQNLHLLEPVSYPEMLKLVADAQAVFTDSGGLQKEAYWLKTPCRTIRPQTEWVETVQLGYNKLIPAKAETIAQAASSINYPEECPPIYGDGNTSPLISKILEKTYFE